MKTRLRLGLASLLSLLAANEASTAQGVAYEVLPPALESSEGGHYTSWPFGSTIPMCTGSSPA